MISCLVLLLLTRSSPLIVLLGVGALFGIPQGLNNLANQNALYAQVEPERTAASAGLLRTFGYIGAIAASEAAGALMPATASSTAMHHLAIFMGVCGALFLIVTLLDRSLQTLRVTETPRPA